MDALGHADFVKVVLGGKKIGDSGSTVLIYTIIV